MVGREPETALICGVRPGDDRALGPVGSDRRDRSREVRCLRPGDRGIRATGQPAPTFGARAPSGPWDLRRRAGPGRDGGDSSCPEFLAFLGDPEQTMLLAHNASFDAGFLGRELARLGRPMPGHAVVDTLALARQRWPKLGTHRLDSWPGGFSLTLTGLTGHRPIADSVRGLWLALESEEHDRGTSPRLPNLRRSMSFAGPQGLGMGRGGDLPRSGRPDRVRRL